MRTVAAGLLAGLLVLAPLRGVRAQAAPTTSGTNDLNFGPVIPGIATQILRTDAANAGRFELRGTRSAEVQITLTLPAAMTAGGGRTMPLTFGPNDGGYDTRNALRNAPAFDPRVPLVTRLGNSGKLYVWLGGTVTPSGVQPAGTYSATITLTAAYTGN